MFCIGILISVTAIIISVLAFKSLLITSAGIAACLCGIYIMKRSTSNEPIRNHYQVTSFDTWVYILFGIAFLLSLLMSLLLFSLKNLNDLMSSVIIYSFIVFSLIATLLGSFLFGRSVYRLFRDNPP